MNNKRTTYHKKRRIKKSVLSIVGILFVGIIAYSTITISSSILALNRKKEEPQETPPEKTNIPVWNDKVDDSYFEDALFIGDSRTQGFIIYTGLETNAYVSTGLTVDTALTKKIGFDQYGHATTLEEGLKQNHYKKVYIMLGINELGWIYSDIFIDHYQKLVQKIQELEPDATIYIQSILPVTKEKSETSIYHNDKIDTYNALLEKMAENTNVTYLNVREAIENGEGILPNEAASDGVHLTQTYCNKWLEYLKTHTLKEKENEK